MENAPRKPSPVAIQSMQLLVIRAFFLDAIQRYQEQLRLAQDAVLAHQVSTIHLPPGPPRPGPKGVPTSIVK